MSRNYRNTPLIQIWLGAHAVGYQLVWSVARRRVVMRRMPA